VRARLEAGPVALRVRDLANPRVAREFEALDRLKSASDDTAGALKASLEARFEGGVRPEALLTLHRDYEAHLTWSEDPRLFDATFMRRARASESRVPETRLDGPPRPWRDYVHRASPTTHLASDLRTYLQAKLPDFMVPSHFVSMGALPLTPNGKIDRGALPAPESSRDKAGEPFAPAATDLERTIVAVWQEILNVERIGVHDNFFDLGANSLLMMRANSRLQAVLGRSLSLVDMFQNPTIAALAAHLAASEATQAETGSAAARSSRERALARLDALQGRRERLGSLRQPSKR